MARSDWQKYENGGYRQATEQEAARDVLKTVADRAISLDTCQSLAEKFLKDFPETTAPTEMTNEDANEQWHKEHTHKGNIICYDCGYGCQCKWCGKVGNAPHQIEGVIGYCAEGPCQEKSRAFHGRLFRA